MPLNSPARDTGPPLRVLVVDDNADCADSTALLLRTVGFEARACYDGFAALELIGPFRPGVCFLDLNMPGMDGDELAVRLRKWARRRRLVLVALTAMSGPASSRRIGAAGFDLHLVKPVDPFTLVRVVDKRFQAWAAAAPAPPGLGRGPDRVAAGPGAEA